MKPGVRSVGVAESTDGDRTSTLAGTVVRADSVVDGLAYASCTVGGTDATRAIVSLLDDLDRPDARYVLVGAVAPAGYNLLDLSAITAESGLPVVAVTFAASDGLEEDLRATFSGSELDDRLERYRALPPRRAVSVGTETVYVRAVGLPFERAETVVRTFTEAGGRPEPVRVARLAARAGHAYRRRECE